MQEYRDKASTAGESTGTSNALDTDMDTVAMPQYMSLAEQYGIQDELEIGESSDIAQTIEQEYQAYITAPIGPNPKKIDILKFWEVGGSINGGAHY
jgi:hypothetical protein